MKPLIPQTVYINPNPAEDGYKSIIHFKVIHNQYIFTKEELIEFSKRILSFVTITNPYQEAKRFGLKGDSLSNYINNNTPKIDTKKSEQFINNLLNQQ